MRRSIAGMATNELSTRLRGLTEGGAPGALPSTSLSHAKLRSGFALEAVQQTELAGVATLDALADGAKCLTRLEVRLGRRERLNGGCQRVVIVEEVSVVLEICCVSELSAGGYSRCEQCAAQL